MGGKNQEKEQKNVSVIFQLGKNIRKLLTFEEKANQEQFELQTFGHEERASSQAQSNEVIEMPGDNKKNKQRKAKKDTGEEPKQQEQQSKEQQSKEQQSKEQQSKEQQNKNKENNGQNKNRLDVKESKKGQTENCQRFKHPFQVTKVPLTPGELRAKQQAEKNAGEKEELIPEKLFVNPCLEINKTYLGKIYSLPKNKDIIIREFYINFQPPLKAFLVFIDGLSDKGIINNHILKPLMVFLDEQEKVNVANLAEYIKEHLLPGHDVTITEKYRDILDNVNYGSTAIFIEGSAQCLLVETKGWDRRSVGQPEIEQVILGPHEAFNETLRSNTGLIRKALRNEKLITEMVKVGSCNKIDVAVMYLEDLANPQLVQEVQRRITSIKTDYIGVSGVLEQFIEDAPWMLSPQVLTTERPDRVVSFLVEGHVAIIIDGGPHALIVPATLFSLLHSPEDYYLRLPYGNFLRVLRIFAGFIAILTPAIYVSIVTYHQEMIPTELLLAIAASRVTVPFPTIFEVFAMEFAFELIREAGVRVPGVIGNTIGIVGALILGQAAVQAGIVSPILIIVIAITGLASFAIPNFSISFGFRGIRFVFTIFAAFFGFFGVAGALFLMLISAVSMNSFGVPFLAPIAPKTKSEPVLLRGAVWQMEEREDYLHPLERRRQPKISRGWLKALRRGGQK